MLHFLLPKKHLLIHIKNRGGDKYSPNAFPLFFQQATSALWETQFVAPEASEKCHNVRTVEAMMVIVVH